MTVKYWTKEEDNLIIDTYLKYGRKGLSKLYISRSNSAILSRLHRLSLKEGSNVVLSDVEKVKKVSNIWSEDDINLLLSLYPVYGAKGCKSRGLNKSELSIKNKAKSLGLVIDNNNYNRINLKHNWTKEEITILKLYYRKGGSTLCKKKGVLKSSRQIYRKARLLGLKVNCGRGYFRELF